MGLTVALLGPVAAARADTSVSINWAGYAVHHAGVKFRKVTGTWQVPTGMCKPGSDGYSAFWVGLGGYSLTAQALEQVGTEFDCTPTGRAVLFAWYELVPSPSHPIRMRIDPGDVISARVVAARRHVKLTIIDRTRGTRFSRSFKDRHMDTSSAEWITEAPSLCFGPSRCQVLPLADFGSVGFTRTVAQTTRYRTGGISSDYWKVSRIQLGASSRRYVSGGTPILATTSTLGGGGRSFTVRYTGTPATGSGAGTSSGAIVGRPRHPGRLAPAG